VAEKRHSILRFVHIENLDGILKRRGMYAPNHAPDDGIIYQTIHSQEVQNKRSNYRVPAGPGGCLHDYVPFYFGCHSPMMLQLHTGKVPDYHAGQRPLIYLVSYAEDVAKARCQFAFTDGHGIAAFTQFFDDLANLDKVDWNVVRLKYWADAADDNDRQRRKQAEFLVHCFVPWKLIKGIAVIDEAMKTAVDRILAEHPSLNQPIVKVLSGWYY
jgi:hypothetical protein